MGKKYLPLRQTLGAAQKQIKKTCNAKISFFSLFKLPTNF
jgi:hypothetical protein